MTSAGARLTVFAVPVNRRFLLADGRRAVRLDDLNGSPFIHVDGERCPRPVAPDEPVAEVLPVEIESRNTAPVEDPLMRSA